MNWAGSLCRDLGTLVKRNKNQLCGDMTTEPAQLAWIPVIPMEVFQVITLAGRPGERTNRETGQRVTRRLLRIVSNLFIKMAAPG